MLLNLTIKDLFDYSENKLSKSDLIKLISKELKTCDIDDLKTIRKMINLIFEYKK